MTTFMKTLKGMTLAAWLWGIWLALRGVTAAPPHQGDKPLLPGDALVFQPQLARLLGGPNEALIVQKVHEWLLHNERNDKRSHYRDGRWWTYNSYEEWQADHFCHISVASVKRLFRKLVQMGVLITVQHRQQKGDSRNWYTIDYAALAMRTKESQGGINLIPGGDQKSPRGVQNDPLSTGNLQSESAKKKPKPQPTPTPPAPLPPAATIDDADDLVSQVDPGDSDFSSEAGDVAALREDRNGVISRTPPPDFAAPPAPQSSADRLIAAMVRAYAPALTMVYAGRLVIQFGEGRVRAVHQYVQDNPGKIHEPVGFITWELQRDTLGLGTAYEPEPFAMPDDETEEAPAAAEPEVMDEVWRATFQQLELQDPVNFNIWMRRARLVGVNGNMYTVAVHSVYARDLLQARLYRNVQRILSDCAGGPCELTFVVEEQQPAPMTIGIPAMEGNGDG